ncbi:MAG: CDP-diacylglycerol--serine O-phosphatidyltransferase [Bradymonadales bacterium]|nr:MAG: CDP-diacylglycerol--serine O-phosphatidyltransferase [Bradymonadales bacterium]
MKLSSQESWSRPKKGRRLRARGVMVLPSLLTLMALFAGFSSVLLSLNSLMAGSFEFALAGWAIVLAAFLDGLDGRIARLMKAESEFGSQLDSIADMVSFGVAPAVLAYAMVLSSMGRLGWMAAFLFVACASIRLARFNVSTGEPLNRKYFKGLPSPVAAGGLALFAIFSPQLGSDLLKYMFLGGVLFLSGLMVSNVRFRSFKQLEAVKLRPIRSLLLLMLILVLVVSFGERTLLILFVLYLLGGLLEEAVLFRRRRRSDPSVPFLPFGEKDDSEDSLV